MSTVNIDINPAIFRWIYSTINPLDLKEKSRADLQAWHSGSKKPTLRQLEKFSRETQIPFGYFFLDTPPAEPMDILQYRTVDSQYIDHPSRNLVNTIHEMEAIQEWMRNYLKHSDVGVLPFVGKFKPTDSLSQIVEGIRTDMSLPLDWYTHCSNASESFHFLREKLEKIGVLVMMNGVVGSNTHQPLDVREFRAFTIIDSYAPLIFINSTDSQNGKVFSLVHELTHIWLGENSFYNDYYMNTKSVSGLEVLCNAVAGEILVPMEKFMNKWTTLDGNSIEAKILELAKYFKCGSTVVAWRALDQRLISLSIYSEIADSALKNYEAQKTAKIPGGHYYNTLQSKVDHRFISALSNSIHEGYTTYTEAFQLTHTNRKTFSELVKKTLMKID